MHNESDDKKDNFKVVDRRASTNSDDATKTSDIPVNKSSADIKQAERPVMSFALFIQSLAHQAMMGLGMVAWPDSGLIKVDMTLAKETIDILDILKAKCAGNLDTDEQELVDSILYQLHIIYVESAKLKPTDKFSL